MRVNHRGLRRMATLLRYLMVLLPALLCVAPVAATQTITYYHLDATGSPVAATNQAGALLWRETYKPYGDRTLNQAAASGNSHWYTGKPYDSAIGLSYFGARYYDPVVGRFMGVDPAPFSAGNLQSFNRYAYGNNNPYKYIDPDGRAITLVEFSGALIAGSIIVYAKGTPDQQAMMKRVAERVWEGIWSESSKEDGAKSDSGNDKDAPPSIVDPDRATHILDGDKTGGGHRAGTGKPGKSEFPSNWSDDRVLGEISDVATDPKSTTSPGRGGRTVTRGTRGGVDIDVIVDQNGRIVTGYPTNAPRNPP